MKQIIVVFILASVFFKAVPFTVVIDPGHGGKFDGAVGHRNKVIEKDATLDVGYRLVTLLKQEGFDCVMTRLYDYHLGETLDEDLPKRVEVAAKAKADLFISIHFNQSSNQGVRGFEVYVPYGDVMPKESYSAASFIHHKLSQAIPPEWSGALGNFNGIDRGIRAARYNVLATNPCLAAVLVELDYISNPEAATMVSRPEYRIKLAKVLSEGILEYAGHVQKSKK